MAELRRTRAPDVLDEMISTLRVRLGDGNGSAGRDVRVDDFHRGAVAALVWVRDGGAAPLTGCVDPVPVSPAAVVRELSAANEAIFGRSEIGRLYGGGVEHAIMWAHLASANAPVWDRANLAYLAECPDE
ncbi:hypothetical protein Ae168Ps1_1792c [Pseudonocardia sp. Ae168_Ps1]|uniref:hypothetical protein n=1 Tax=unclassified Pseudonocardia TaxID=2619320 RepID=UPI0002DD8E36|nr:MULTISPECIES: hypothetical protein [unclassified Pseudonocardia]ALE72626.1 hypothetical protein FRP1_05025 [Pseudonocardia sp. EC080625-04]ALL75939.1 hypothetical protein AD006_12660 [Pseudonocardia sp. EC080610-09]ALL82967.1 hypothetical protein AD017_20495 [Pseudonocardia sp. EC080619-01]OLL73410.1 hypothetical protein Ae150APs1_1788c [Pseudonocardia sp. Ae150A_Ps1]OLL79386.1 hypothetical protein Ae168Ps1_1792c [Pseudonocardia sp. Ae168_Ps1]